MRKNKVITKEVESINIDFADNGFVMNFSGKDEDDNWTDNKLIVHSLDELIAQIKRVHAL
jgi:hypothetical protein